MSNPCIRWAGVFLTMVVVSGCLLPSVVRGADPSSPRSSLPLLVRARLGDTPAKLAQRYLQDASKGWQIAEYNNQSVFSAGEAVLIPQRPFRLGGLRPDGIQAVPVLLYEDFTGTAKQKGRLSVYDFRAQMQWLTIQGFIAVTPNQLVDFMAFTGQLPRRAVLITVDTESRFFYEQAVPILQAAGLTATIFIATEKIGRNGAMTWDQIRALNNEGFTIGCRGRNGRSLLRRKKGQTFAANFNWVAAELRLAKQRIEAELDQPCRFLAYPEGRRNRLVAAMAATLGFSAAFNRLPGGTPFFADRYDIHRHRIVAAMQPDQFGRLLTPTMAMDRNR